jgi:hypothetical protein
MDDSMDMNLELESPTKEEQEMNKTEEVTPEKLDIDADVKHEEKKEEVDVKLAKSGAYTKDAKPEDTQ